MSNIPAGWYPDPTNPLQERLWDGNEWIERTRPRQPELAGMSASAQGTPPDGATRPKTYLTSGLFALLLCWPLAIVSIVYAMKVDGAWESGEYVAAQRYSREANRWSLYAGVVFIAVVGGVLAASS